MFQIKVKPPTSRYGLSLVEVLIAMVMTLIVLGAMMAAFSFGSAEMQKGRASIELNNGLITVEELLRRDLDRITVDPRSHINLPALPKGYFEIVDGPQTDYVFGSDSAYLHPLTGAATHPVTGVALGTTFVHGGNEMVFGDRDDYFACTIRSNGKAFRGRNGNNTLESHLAEVVWFTVFDPATPDPNDVLLVRRQLLIHPNPPAAGGGFPAGTLFSSTDAVLANREIAVSEFISRTDISARIVRSAAAHLVIANSLEDLAFRGNRFSHSGSLESLALDPNRDPTDCMLEIFQMGSRFNEGHVMASAIAAFDVQVFAPDASNLIIPNAAGSDIFNIAEPGSIGQLKGNYSDDMDGVAEPLDAIFDAGDPNAAAIAGAYVDLGKGSGVLGLASNGYVFGYNPASGIVGTPSNGYAFGLFPTTGLVMPVPAVQIPGMLLYETFDTGTSQYNRRIANHPGSNGVDDPNGATPPTSDGIVDGPEEELTIIIDPVTGDSVRYETVVPSYDDPIRGLKFTLRAIEPNTKQIRQLTVKKSFAVE